MLSAGLRVAARGLLPRRLCPTASLLLPRALIHSINDGVERQGAYEGAGKTTVEILNKENPTINMIDSFSSDGFRLNDDTKVIGPVVVFPSALLAWKVLGPQDINEDSLSLFKILEPRLDLLVIGYGDLMNQKQVNPRLILKMKQQGINVELLTTENAISVYNYLAEEGRVVAAALIPPVKVNFVDEDIAEGKARRNKLYDISGTATDMYLTEAKKKMRRLAAEKTEKEDDKPS